MLAISSTKNFTANKKLDVKNDIKEQNMGKRSNKIINRN